MNLSRFALVAVLFVVGFMAVVTRGVSGLAQEASPAPFATPGPGEFSLGPGQIGRDLAAGQLADLPPAPVFIAISRITSAPGSALSIAADDAAAALILVESGMGTWRLEGPVMITRTTGQEEIAAGMEFTLGPGESFVWPPNVAGESHNTGSEPVVTLTAYLAHAGQEAVAQGSGTPAP